MQLTPPGSSVDSGNEPQTFFWGLFLYSLSTAFGASTSVIVKLLGGMARPRWCAAVRRSLGASQSATLTSPT